LSEQREALAERFSSEGIIVSANVFDRIIEDNVDIDELVSSVKKNSVWLLTDEILGKFISSSEEIKKVASDIAEPTGGELENSNQVQKPQKVEVTKTKTVYAKEFEADLKFLDEFDVSGKSACRGQLEDFVGYFRERYKNGARILRERMEYRSPVPIERLKSEAKNDPARIICMVTDKRESRRGYKFFDVEDLTGEITILLPKNERELNLAYERVMLDEIVGITGRLSNDIFVADNITKPDLPLTHKPKRSEVDVCTAFISDIHVGSYLFLEREFDNLIRWLEGDGNRRDLADRIKYVVVAGDLVDGVGIYPKQEAELTIPDIKKQYDFLAALLSRIPDHIEIILSMGNHDAVRAAEPQPRLPKELGESLYDLPNVHMVGNPSMVSMHGVETLVYHGTSLDTVIGSLADCTYSAPEKAMVEYLRRRNLVPSYGRGSIAPEERDYMSITRIPDILHCGHVHTNGYTVYHGVSVINSGTFQGKTKYQEQLGHMPTPARVPVMNLQSGEVSVIHFGGEDGG